MDYAGQSARACSARDALGAPGAWPIGEIDLASADMFAAFVASEIGADVAAAARMEGESGRAARRGVVAVAPFDQHDQGWSEFASLLGEDVLRTAGALGVGNALQQPFIAHQLESVAEDVRRDPESLLELLESRRAEDGIAQDQQRPALTDDLERAGN